MYLYTNFIDHKLTKMAQIVVLFLFVSSDLAADEQYSPSRILQSLHSFALTNDLENINKLEKELGIHLVSQKAYPGEKKLRSLDNDGKPFANIDYWVSAPLASLNENRSSWIKVKMATDTTCITIEDVVSEFGDKYFTPPPTRRDFFTKDGSIDGKKISRFLEDQRTKVDQIYYEFHGARTFRVGFTFEFQKCLLSFGASQN